MDNRPNIAMKENNDARKPDRDREVPLRRRPGRRSSCVNGLPARNHRQRDQKKLDPPLPYPPVLSRNAAKSRSDRLQIPSFPRFPDNDDLIDNQEGGTRKRKEDRPGDGQRIGDCRPIARHLAGFFDDVIASDGITNLKGEAKANALVDLYGERGFAYAGNSRSDLPVWRRAKSALLINTNRSVSRTVEVLLPIERKFQDRKPLLRALLREMRPYQWIKNILIFIPSVTGHLLFEGPVFFRTLATFVAFCAAASGIYLINDLLDLETDRNHPRKRNRPFASGELPLHFGLAGPVLAATALAIGFAVSPGIAIAVSVYILLSLVYSKYLKTQPLVDIFCLAALYTIRVFAGESPRLRRIHLVAEFFGFPVSRPWVPEKTHGIFFNLSNKGRNQGSESSENTWETIRWSMMMGVGSSFIASMILGFYVNSVQAHIEYRNPVFLWGIVPLILFWQCRMWLSTIRGYMLDDPIVYAVKDKISYYVMAFIVLIYLLASVEVIPFIGHLSPGRLPR